MGIRFTCPNGHKLNVKAELAGKVGFCPKCKARMLIPLKSTRTSHKNNKSKLAEAPFVNETEKEFSLDQQPFVQQTLDSFMDEQTISSLSKEELLSQVLTSNKPGVSDFVLAGQSATILPDLNGNLSNFATKSPEEFPTDSLQPTPLSKDLLSNEFPNNGSHNKDSQINDALSDPTIVWYLRSGNQNYGPASNEVIRTWLYEKRIGPNMLVWREGWSNWLEAKNVFPELETLFPPDLSKDFLSEKASLPTEMADQALFYVPEVTISSTLIKTKKSNKKNQKDFILIVGLIFFIVVLLILLIIILLNQKTNTKKEVSRNLESWQIMAVPQDNFETNQTTFLI
ncbi:MAG: DUF4339 domain-containing protein [Planctomycetia bacterium]|nr:DUF4339 domain-containing protein [Planctomycetia bacterium]